MKLILLAALGGALGASGRYLVGVLALRSLGSAFPYGTMIVNVAGAILMGLFIHLLAVKLNGSPELRTFVATGILGGFTTFSAYSLEVVNMIERGDWGTALFYALASVVFCVLGIFIGLWFGRMLGGSHLL